MYFNLFGRDDRLGANITTFIAQIIYAVNNNLCIKYDKKYLEIDCRMRYNSSIFIESLYDYIDDHNKKLNNSFDECVDIKTNDFFYMISRTLLNIKCDYITYFKDRIFPNIKENFFKKASIKNYNLPFDPKKTILVHLRLDDVKHFSDYDGRICANFFRKKIDNDEIVSNNTNSELINAVNSHNYNRQSPIPVNRVQEQINNALKLHPDHTVIIITNPGEDVSFFPYKCIQSHDENYDLFLLCNSEIVILSKSTYSLCSLFFGMVNEAYIPVWGHIPCFGIYTKYDNIKYNLFF